MCLNRKFGFWLISILAFMLLQKAFVLIMWCLIMRCLSQEGKWQWGNNDLGPSLNVMLLKNLHPKESHWSHLCLLKVLQSRDFFFFPVSLMISGCFSIFQKGPGSGSIQASGWQSLAEWHSCQVQDKSISPSVTVRTFISTFRTWHVPNCPITPCLSLKCAAKHWVWEYIIATV